MNNENITVKTKKGFEWSYLDIVYINAYNEQNNERCKTSPLIELSPIVTQDGEVDFEKTSDSLKQALKDKYDIDLQFVHDLICGYDFGMIKDVLKDTKTNEYYGLFVSEGSHADKIALIEKINIVDWSYLANTKTESGWDRYLSEDLGLNIEEFWGWYKNYTKTK